MAVPFTPAHQSSAEVAAPADMIPAKFPKALDGPLALGIDLGAEFQLPKLDLLPVEPLRIPLFHPCSQSVPWI